MNDNISKFWTRRRFLECAAAAGGTMIAAPRQMAAAQPAATPPGRRPLIIASANGVACTARAMERIAAGDDPLDAAIAGVNLVENDPNDHSVGLGGLPNEDGVVELDASVMHGPSHKAGAVAAMRNIRNPSCVARLVMQRTNHVLLVGEGALRFARAHGFKEEDLLTDEARREWLKWKESHSDKDAWIAPENAGGKPSARAGTTYEHTWGTIHCSAVDEKGNLGGVTTTSGLSFKIPGRVGDSPIIGAGLYVDNAVGAAGSTGFGESNLRNCSTFLIVELMRGGMGPREACLEALRRIADRTEQRHRGKGGLPINSVTFYAITKDGRYAGASMYSGARFAVCDHRGARQEDCAWLFERKPD